MESVTEIRKATIADALVLSKLASSTFFDTFNGTCTPQDMDQFLDFYYNESELYKELSNPEDHYYLALINDEAVGYLRFGENPVPYTGTEGKKALELNRLYVTKQVYGKGIARDLMQVYENFATTYGYQYLWLGVWEQNYRAQAFYRKQGYVYTGSKHPFPIGNTPQTDEWWAKIL